MWNSRLSRTSPWRAVLGAARLAAGCFLGLLIAGSAGAHRGHGVWIELVWASDRFEITHHLHLQDAQSVLERVDPGSDLGSPRSLAQLALYVEQHFAVHTEGEVITLEPGATINLTVDQPKVWWILVFHVDEDAASETVELRVLNDYGYVPMWQAVLLSLPSLWMTGFVLHRIARARTSGRHWLESIPSHRWEEA